MFYPYLIYKLKAKVEGKNGRDQKKMSFRREICYSYCISIWIPINTQAEALTNIKLSFK